MPRPEIEPLEHIQTTAFKERKDIIAKVNEIIEAINQGGIETIFVDVRHSGPDELLGDMTPEALQEFKNAPTVIRFRYDGSETQFIQVLGATVNQEDDRIRFVGYGALSDAYTGFWTGYIDPDGWVRIASSPVRNIQEIGFEGWGRFDKIGAGDLKITMDDGTEYWAYIETLSPLHHYTKVTTDDGIHLDFDWGTNPFDNFLDWLDSFHEDQGLRFNVYHSGMGFSFDLKTFDVVRSENYPDNYINFFYIVRDPTSGATADKIKLCRGVLHWNWSTRIIECLTEEIAIGGSGSVEWGQIGGDISAQGDLNDSLHELSDRIDSISLSGRYLALWNCVTGKPTTEPPTALPYTYRTGDFYIISNYDGHVANYMPSGTQYTGAASTTPVTGEPAINDVYKFDGTTWVLIKMSLQSVAFSSIAGSPYDNLALGAELNAKSNVSDIKDILTSTETDKPLSANQGRILNVKTHNATEKMVEVALSVTPGTADQFSGTLTETQFNNLKSRSNYILKGGITLPNGVWTLYCADVTVQTITDGTDTEYRLHGMLASGGHSIATFNIVKAASPATGYVLNGKMNNYASSDSVDSLEDEVAAINTKGRLLGNWSDVTGKGNNVAVQVGFVYAAGDYFIIDTIASPNPELMPYGTSYSDVASTVAYSGTETIALGDYWVFAAGAWTLEHAHSFFEDFKNIAGRPIDNPQLEARYVGITKSDTITGHKKFKSYLEIEGAANSTPLNKKCTDIDITVTPTSDTDIGIITLNDQNGVRIGYLRLLKKSTGKIQLSINLRNIDGTTKSTILAESD